MFTDMKQQILITFFIVMCVPISNHLLDSELNIGTQTTINITEEDFSKT